MECACVGDLSNDDLEIYIRQLLIPKINKTYGWLSWILMSGPFKEPHCDRQLWPVRRGAHRRVISDFDSCYCFFLLWCFKFELFWDLKWIWKQSINNYFLFVCGFILTTIPECDKNARFLNIFFRFQNNLKIFNDTKQVSMSSVSI